jgi:hypothetical protein
MHKQRVTNGVYWVEIPEVDLSSSVAARPTA